MLLRDHGEPDILTREVFPDIRVSMGTLVNILTAAELARSDNTFVVRGGAYVRRAALVRLVLEGATFDDRALAVRGRRGGVGRRDSVMAPRHLSARSHPRALGGHTFVLRRPARRARLNKAIPSRVIAPGAPMPRPDCCFSPRSLVGLTC
jgi:hypothetical protein